MNREFVFLVIVVLGAIGTRWLDSISNGGNFEMYTWTLFAFLLIKIARNTEIKEK